MGMVQNWVQILGNNPIMWCIPTLVREREAGAFFPSVPIAQQMDHVKVSS